MARLNVYSAKGAKKNSMSLPKRLEEPANLALLAQAIRVYEARGHPHLSKTKTRGEVTASKAKIYRQKGTGRARHGARSAPIFVGGGVTHGPKGVKRELTLPKKMRRKSLKAALTLKAKNGEMVVVDGISSLKKTKDGASLLAKISSGEKDMKGNERFTFVLSDKNKDARLALRNIKNVEVFRFEDLNAYRVYFGGILIVDKDALEESKKTFVSKTSRTRQKSSGHSGGQASKVDRTRKSIKGKRSTKSKSAKPLKKSV